MSASGPPETVALERVTPSFFNVLGVTPLSAAYPTRATCIFAADPTGGWHERAPVEEPLRCGSEIVGQTIRIVHLRVR